jgi:acyl-CoA synthetase (AMP-forming)/AMP-acid ligase II
MQCLIDRHSSCEENKALWLSNTFGSINLSQLAELLLSIDPMAWHNKRVAIGLMPAIELLAALTLLDGLAQAIILLPAEDDVQTREARLAQCRVDIVLDDDGFGFAKLLSKGISTDSCGVIPLAFSKRPTSLQTSWLLPTSGTTGIPKVIAHTFASLTRSMTARRIGDDYTWGSLYSFRRFAGLQVFFQSWMCSTPLILNDEHANLQDALTCFIDFGCNALSATPSMWRKLAMHPLFNRLNLRQITLGGEIVDQTVLDMLAKQFPVARITHIYASTEAGVGFAVRDGRAGFPADYLQHPPLGLAMRIDDQNHLWFGSAVDKALVSGSEHDWIDSGDVVEKKGDRVRFLGRANGSINVGGNKVMPEEIEAVIKELPDIALVQVRARKSTMLGSLVEAAIVPIRGTNVDVAFKKKVTDHCRARLDGFKVPAFIVAATTIQLTASGKLSREHLQ